MESCKKVNKMVDMIYKIKDLATTDIENGHIKTSEMLEEYLDEAYDNACIYYSDCFDIVKQAGATDFSPYIEEFGATTINSIAYWVLREEANNYGLMEELEDLLDAYICHECLSHKTECTCDLEEEE